MGQVNRVDSCKLAVERANTLGARSTGDAAADSPQTDRAEPVEKGAVGGGDAAEGASGAAGEGGSASSAPKPLSQKLVEELAVQRRDILAINLASNPAIALDYLIFAIADSRALYSAQALGTQGDAVHFLLEAYRHGKPLCLIGEAVQLLRVPGAEGGDAPGVVTGANDPATRLPMAQAFIQAIARHRHWGRPGADAVPA